MSEAREKVREKLRANSLTYKWLQTQLEARGFTNLSKTYISKIFGGSRTGLSAQIVIDESLRILENYESNILQSK